MVSKKEQFPKLFRGKTICSLLCFGSLTCSLRVCSMNEWKSKSAIRFLLFYYSFISFSRRAKINFIGTISRLCIRLFLATCWLNIEMTSWYHGLVYALNVRYYIFYREYLYSDEWMSHLCKRAKRAKRAMNRLKNQVCKKSKSG